MSDLLSANFEISDELSLTEIRFSDKDSIVKHINDPEIYKNTLHIPYPYFEKDAEEFISICRRFEELFSHVDQFAIRLNGEMIGAIGFLYSSGESSHKAEIGYWISPFHRRKGIITKAINKILEIGFGEKGLFRIEANVFSDNIASKKVLEKVTYN